MQATNNENHITIEYVKKSKIDFDFFPNIGIPRSVHVIMLSWASGHIIIGSQKSHLPHPNLPSVRQTSLGNPKLQRCQFPILTTDLKSTVKTAVLSFFEYSN